MEVRTVRESFLLFIAVSLIMVAQTTGYLSIKNGVINFGSAVHTTPTIVVANTGALPSSGCTAGELALVTSATLGQQIYENSGSGTCTWTQQTGGTLTGGTISGALACVAASGSPTTYTCTTSPSFTPGDGSTVLFVPDDSNTGATTLAVNGASAAAILETGGVSPTGPNDLIANQVALLTYKTACTCWQMMTVPGFVYPTAFGSWTQINFGSGTGTSANGNLTISTTSTASRQMIGLALPATPFTLDFQMSSQNVGASAAFEIGLNESSTGKGAVMGFNGTQTYLITLTSNTSFGAFCCGIGANEPYANFAPYVYWRIQDTGTVIRFFISPNKKDWFQFGTDTNVTTLFTTAPNRMTLDVIAGVSGLPAVLSVWSIFSH